jgi:polysaccharide export outer membrane protein
VVGLTARGLEERLTVLLEKDYLVNPQVSVFIKEYAKVSVLGEVKKPGSYELRAGTTAIEAIALGGGFTEIANMTDVKLTRVEGGQKRTIVIDATKITEEGGKKDDVLLKPNDIIVVEQLGMISVVGQVKKPGRFILDKNLTVIEAIALAGGLTEIASANGTKVIRKKNGKEETINVPVDSILRGSDRSKNIYLEPNDTVVVPESFF